VGFTPTAFFVATGNHAALINAAGVFIFSFLAGISLKFASMYSVAGVSTLPFLDCKQGQVLV
jgi:Na+-translocating ferredoxin:NAD+ oxidoreductase RnfD subunit